MWFFYFFFTCWPFHQKLVSKSHLTTLFCQSLHHLLTPNASFFFLSKVQQFSSAKTFCVLPGSNLKLGTTACRFHLRSVTAVRGVYSDSLSSARITTEVIDVIWSSWNTWEKIPVFDFEVIFLLGRFQSYLLNTSKCNILFFFRIRLPFVMFFSKNKRGPLNSLFRFHIFVYRDSVFFFKYIYDIHIYIYFIYMYIWARIPRHPHPNPMVIYI